MTKKTEAKRREVSRNKITGKVNSSVSGSVFDGALTRNFCHVENNKVPNILSKPKPRSILAVEACLEAKLILSKKIVKWREILVG